MDNNEIIKYLTEKSWLDTLRNKVMIKKVGNELYYFYNNTQNKLRLVPPNLLYIESIKGLILFERREIHWTNNVKWYRKEYDNLDLYYTNRGLFYILPNDFWFVQTLKTGVAWDNNLIERVIGNYIKDKNNVLDIGAHIGTHAIPYAKAIKGKVYAFEMQPPIIDILMKNIKINDISNIEVHHNAVGHLNNREVSINDKFIYRDTLKNGLQYDTVQPMNYGGVQIGEGHEHVMMRTIDSFNFENVDYIKMDIEGSEELALHGAMETIRRCRPVICFEMRPDVVINESMRKVVEIDERIINGNTLKYLVKELKYIIETNEQTANHFLIPMEKV